ncbi:MAG: chromosomal replication initiator protein DnaA [Pseudomonadota bacterium]
MSNKKDLWARITRDLESSLSASEFDTWFANTTLKNLDREKAIIEVPNRFVATWLRDNYLTKIQDSFKSNLHIIPEIHFTHEAEQATSHPREYRPIKNSGVGTTHNLNPLLTFNTFITGKSNRLAYSSALSVARQSAANYNPLYIFSELSLGKTHLLNAIGNEILSNNPAANVRYLPANLFSSDLMSAIRDGKLRNFRRDYRNFDLLLLDDIQLLAASEISQLELISLFNRFYESNRQMVIAGSHPAAQIQNLIPKLTSRLEWGLLSEISIPEQKTKTRILRQKAKDLNLDLPEDVVFFLANSSNNLKTLEEILSLLRTRSSLYQGQIDMSTVNSLISKSKAREIIPLNDIQKVITAKFNVSLTQLLSAQKKRKFSYPRQLGMYLSRHLTDLSLKEIGDSFGKKDHSTVIYAIRRIEKYVKDGKTEVVDDMNELLRLLEGQL